MHSATESHDQVLGWLTDHKIKSKLLSKTITSFIQFQATDSPARACSNGVPCPSAKFKGTGTAVSEYLTGSGGGAAIGTGVASDVLGDLDRISARRGPTGETALECGRGPTGLALVGGALGGGLGKASLPLILSNWARSSGGIALNFAVGWEDGRGGGGGGNSWAIGDQPEQTLLVSKIKTAVMFNHDKVASTKRPCKYSNVRSAISQRSAIVRSTPMFRQPSLSSFCTSLS